MTVCVRCGHGLGVGRFCTNCGHPVGAPAPDVAADPVTWRTDTAERPAVARHPEPARYPLYADEAAPAETRSHHAATPRRTEWPVWLGVALVLVLLAGLGVWLLFGGEDRRNASAHPTSGRSADGDASPSLPALPSPSEEPGEPSDVARFATVVVPATAAPNQDTQGNLVRYEGRNMLDGVPETTWRMPGDGSGETIVLTLDAPTTVTTLGIVNGYAKTSGPFDWYAGNRRVLSVVWELDDGTTLSQDLEETRGLQTIEVPDGVTTDTVRLTLVAVSPPGTGRERRDYTAISEVSILGVPE